MSPITVYHNPSCSKSRTVVQLLQNHAVEPNIVLYLEQPLNVDQLSRLRQALDLPVVEWIRFGEARAKALGISRDDPRSEADWLTLLAENPILVERPIVEHQGKAIVGRPPERVISWLDQ